MLWLRFLILGAVGLVFGIADDWYAITLISTAILSLTGLLFIWSRFVLRGVRFAREVPNRVSVGDPITEIVTLSNTSLLGKLYIEIEDQTTLPGHNARRVVSMGPRTKARKMVTSLARQRGKHSIGPVVLRSSDPLGFFKRELRIPLVNELTVYPLVVALPGYQPASLLQSDGGTIHRRSHIPTPAVGGVREYVIGDAINIISWSATARSGRLMSKEFDVDPTSDVWIVLDIGADGSLDSALIESSDPIDWLANNLEYRIMLASSLAARLLDIGRAVGLLINSEHPVRLEAHAGNRQFLHINETLAAVSPVQTTRLAELLLSMSHHFRPNTAVLVITSSPDIDLAGTLSVLKRRRISPEVFLVEDHDAVESFAFVEMLLTLGVPYAQLTRFDHPSTILRGNPVAVRTSA